jgi:hypothetical protein
MKFSLHPGRFPVSRAFYLYTIIIVIILAPHLLIMQVDSLVKVETDFTEQQLRHPDIDYPVKDTIITVSNISPHPNKEVRDLGIVLLEFYEHPDGIPLCDKTVNGDHNFVELQPPMQSVIHELMSNAISEPVY